MTHIRHGRTATPGLRPATTPPSVSAVGRVEVLLCTVEDQDHALSAAVVELCIGTEAVDLTPAEARELARLLLDGANRAEAHQ